MIDLVIQIRLITFSFIFGFFFSGFIEILNKKINKCKNYVKLLLSFISIFICTFIYFKGIEKIGNAIFHIYSIISIVVGFVFYDVLVKLIANSSKK